VGSNHPIVLRGDEADASVQQRLDGIQHVQGCTLADPGFVSYAVGGSSRVFPLPLRRLRLRLGGLDLTPILGHISSDLITNLIEIEALLANGLLVLANG